MAKSTPKSNLHLALNSEAYQVINAHFTKYEVRDGFGLLIGSLPSNSDSEVKVERVVPLAHNWWVGPHIELGIRLTQLDLDSKFTDDNKKSYIIGFYLWLSPTVDNNWSSPKASALTKLLFDLLSSNSLIELKCKPAKVKTRTQPLDIEASSVNTSSSNIQSITLSYPTSFNSSTTLEEIVDFEDHLEQPQLKWP